MIKKFLVALTAIAVAVTTAVAVAAPAHAGRVSLGYNPGFQAEIVQVADLSLVDPNANLPGVVEVYRGDVSPAYTACPGGRYCAYVETSFNGAVYMWSSAWNNKCVPVGAPFKNNVDSFANAMTGYQAHLASGPGCTVATTFQVLNPWTNDADLAPYRSTLESFLTPFYG